MQSRLIIKNFGPIDHVDLDLRNVNVFIGPQASGKSAIAKIYTIFKAPGKFLKNRLVQIEQGRASIEFMNVLEEYNIHNFLRTDTEILFDSRLHSLDYTNGVLAYVPKLHQIIMELKELSEDFEFNKPEIIELFEELREDFALFDTRVSSILGYDYDILRSRFDNIDPSNFADVLRHLEQIENHLSTNAALYIPSERNIVTIIRRNLANLQLNNVPIPKNILSFAAELEKISQQKFDLDFISPGLSYKVVNGEDRIFNKDGYSISLSESASGIQSVIPILLPVTHKKRTVDHSSFVIEEPELNLFPSAQYRLIQLLESKRSEAFWQDSGTLHTYTTHSPYVLSALNNFLYGYKVCSKLYDKDVAKAELKGKVTKELSDRFFEKNTRKVKQVVKARIDPDFFSAYQVSSGTAESIFNRETGLIDDNFIDASSDEIADDFEKLMELTR